MRIVLGGLVGGLVFFIWGAVWHIALPLKSSGISWMSQASEPAVLSAMKAGITEPGFYFFPGGDVEHMTESQRAEWTKKLQAGPSGILVIAPGGSEGMTPRLLVIEFASNVAAALCAAVLMTHITGRYPVRVLMLTLAGLLGWVSISISYWNWYGFPTSFTLAAGVEEAVGWLLSGLAIAAIVKPYTPHVPAASAPAPV
jgi:hypothetical protein